MFAWLSFPPVAVAQLWIVRHHHTHVKINMKSFKITGLVGLAITIVLNLVALLVLKRASAEYFSDQWWLYWFPLYMVWLVFIIFGFASCCRKKPDATKHDA
jgi:hypothetical protein